MFVSSKAHVHISFSFDSFVDSVIKKWKDYNIDTVSPFIYTETNKKSFC